MSIAETGPWTLPVYIAPPLILLGLAACVYGVRKGLERRRKYAAPDRYGLKQFERGEGTWLAAGCAVSALTTVVIAAISFFPYGAEYHQWRAVSGTVAAVDSRLVTQGSSSLSERFVVTFEGSSQPFAIDDTRAATVRPGDDLTIACKREWVYASVDGYGCRWATS